MATRLTTIQIVSQLKSELDSLLDGDSGLLLEFQDGVAPPARIDIVQNDTQVCLLVEVPGIPADQLEVTVSGKLVSVSGNKIAPSVSSEPGRFLCIERPWGRFERSVELPVIVNPRKGRALLAHGVLRIEFPILAEQRNQPIRLEVEDAAGGKLD